MMTNDLRFIGSDAEAELVARFRKALIREHADDWTMEVVSESAHICARVVFAGSKKLGRGE